MGETPASPDTLTHGADMPHAEIAEQVDGSPEDEHRRSKVDVCVIIPTYNERENIAELVAQILALDGDMRIIVVDDNSPDGTGQLVDELVEQHDRVGVIHRKGKLGLGTAYIAGLKKGMEEGAGRLITMDADFSHHPGAIPALLELANRFPIALGSRYVPAGNVEGFPFFCFRILLAVQNKTCVEVV